MKYVLITGVASGIGYATLKEFINKGYYVIGIDIKKVDHIDNVIFFKADITKNEDLNHVSNYLITNNIYLDMIINIAGVHNMLSLVENDYDDIERILNINLNGPIRVNNIFHKHLKKDGRIIIITSEVASFAPLPFNGIYSVSKIALDAYAQSLRQELNLLGQKVITIRPGAIKTPLEASSKELTNRLINETNLYKKESVHFLSLVNNFAGRALDVDKFAKYIYKVSNKKHPKLIYKKHQNLGLFLLGILPKRLQCLIVKMLLNR